MSAAAEWALAALALALGWAGWGWRGLLLGLSAVVFWLLLQFGRSLRALRAAAARPVGVVDSAVMLHSRLRRGMRLAQVLPLAGSLGARVAPPPGADAAWCWRDPGGAQLQLEFARGRLLRWSLQRSPAPGVRERES